jgi:hypothetical protein
MPKMTAAASAGNTRLKEMAVDLTKLVFGEVFIAVILSDMLIGGKNYRKDNTRLILCQHDISRAVNIFGHGG